MKNIYIVVPIIDIKTTWFSKAIVQQKESDLKKSLDGTKAIVKFPIHIQKKEDIPEKWKPIFQKYYDNNQVLTYQETKTLMATPEW